MTMTLQDSVRISAEKLDTIKPKWYTLVPLEDGKINMMGTTLTCTGCILDHVFKEEAMAAGVVSGYLYARTSIDLIYGTQRAPFAADEALPFWKQEIAARLAIWTPDPDVLNDLLDARCEAEASS